MVLRHWEWHARHASAAKRLRPLSTVALLAAAILAPAMAARGLTAAHQPGWRVTSVSRDGGEASDVACITVTRCLVLGSGNHVSYAPGDGVSLAPTNGFVAQSRNGIVTATAHGLQAQNALACVAYRCVAVGGSPSGMLADELRNGRWGPLAVHGPDAPYGEALDSVACVAAGRCFAAGITEVQTTRTCTRGVNSIYCYVDVPIIETLRDRAWSAFLPVARSHAGTEPIYRSTIACGSPRICVAVLPSAAGWLASVWRDGSWLPPARLPLSDETDAEITALSCTRLGTCMAVGSYLRDRHRVPLTLQRGHARWRLIPVRRPTVRLSYFSDVSCPGPAGCVAVGSGFSADGQLRSLVERFTAGRWSSESTPRIRAGAALTAVACTAIDACEAVGNFGPAMHSSWFIERYR